MTDILATIDAAVGCQHCGGPLGDSPSDDFCGPDHQQAWHAERSDRLVGYREPWDDRIYRPARDAMSVLDFRLPRQTGNLRADERALCRAVLAASTPAQVAACRLRREQLSERKTAMLTETMEALTAPLAEAAQRFAEIGRGLFAALQPLSTPLASLAEAVKQDAGARQSVMERALQAKRSRGTGPAPRRLDGRRAR